MRRFIACALILSTLSSVGTMCFSMSYDVEKQDSYVSEASPKYDLENIKTFCSDYMSNIHDHLYLDAFNTFWKAYKDIYYFLLDNESLFNNAPVSVLDLSRESNLSVLDLSETALITLLSGNYDVEEESELELQAMFIVLTINSILL